MSFVGVWVLRLGFIWIRRLGLVGLGGLGRRMLFVRLGVDVRSVYLDTGAIVKRYVVEDGSDRVDAVYKEAYAGRLVIGFSMWNIGEVATVFDEYKRRGNFWEFLRVFLRSLWVRLGFLRGLIS